MSDSPIISTIIPCYNPRFDFFKDAIESVLSQSYTSWEAIVVNDGSDFKNTVSINSYIKNLNDKRITVLNLDKNYGASTARNKGIEATKGEIITFLDCDDILLPWFYKEIIEYLSKNSSYSILCTFPLQYFSIFKIKCIYCTNPLVDFLNIGENSDALLEKLKNAEKFVLFLLFIKKEAFKLVSFDSRLKIGEDKDLFIQIFSNGDLANQVKILPNAGLLYRIYLSNSRLTSDLIGKFQYSEELINKYKNSKNIYACKMIKHLEEQHNYFKFSNIFNKYFKKLSIFEFITDITKTNKPFTEKVICIGEFIKSMIEQRFLLPLFGFDGRHIRNLLYLKSNKYKVVKKIFLEYLQSNNANGKTKLHAKRIFQKIF